jgi:hypothetical protein
MLNDRQAGGFSRRPVLPEWPSILSNRRRVRARYEQPAAAAGNDLGAFGAEKQDHGYVTETTLPMWSA